MRTYNAACTNCDHHIWDICGYPGKVCPDIDKDERSIDKSDEWIEVFGMDRWFK